MDSDVMLQRPSGPTRRSGNSRNLIKEIYTNISVYLMISPFYILFAIFGLFPILFSFYLAFHEWNGVGAMRFVGLGQFRFLLTDKEFWKSIANTFEIWIYSTIPMLFFALIIAFLLHSSLLRFKEVFRVIYFLPNVTSIVAVAIIFGTLFGNEYGMLNFLLSSMGLPTIQWLNSPFWVKICISVMIIWRWTGYNAIIFLAGLQSIPSVFYEAARVDGASTTQIFLRITIPLLRPAILFAVITSTIGGMQVFTEPQILTSNSGGPGGGGMTIVLYLYQQAFVKNLFGYGSAVAIGLFIITVLFSLINWLAVQKFGANTRGVN